MCKENLSGLPVVTWPVCGVACGVACDEHKLIGASTENLMWLISPVAFTTGVAGERNMATVYDRLDIPIIRNLTVSGQSLRSLSDSVV